MEVRRVFEDGATNTRRVSTRFEETKTSSPIMDSWVSGEEVRITTHADLRRIKHQTTRRAEVEEALTMVPLLRRAPLAQKELVMRSRGMTWLVWRSHSAPQAE